MIEKTDHRFWYLRAVMKVDEKAARELISLNWRLFT